MCVEEIKKEESIIAITTTIAANPPPLPTPVQEIRFQTNHHYANVPVAVPAPAAIVPPQQPMPIMSYAPAPASYSLDPSAAVYNQSIPYQAVSFSFLNLFIIALIQLFNFLKPDGTLYVLSQQPLMYSYAPTVCKIYLNH